MDRDTFKPRLFVHIAGLGMAVFLAYMGYRFFMIPERGIAFRVAAALACAVGSIGVIWLYLRGGLIAYKITGEALEIRRISGCQVIPWDGITEIRWNRALNFFTLRNPRGIISFTSTDGFSGTGDLIYQIHQRSGCRMSDALKSAVYGVT